MGESSYMMLTWTTKDRESHPRWLYNNHSLCLLEPATTTNFSLGSHFSFLLRPSLLHEAIQLIDLLHKHKAMRL